MKILFVGGTFDRNGGRASGLVKEFSNLLDCRLFNGGRYEELAEILETVKNYDVVFWWANVPNDLPKVRDVKAVNPHALLVSSKRNDGSKYNFAQLINRALEAKSNLVIEFQKTEYGIFTMRAFDPLGAVWYTGTAIADCAKAVMNRLVFLKSITRIGSRSMGEAINVPEQPPFFEIVKDAAETFHHIIQPDPQVTRFLGNSSFRCQRGFPSFRGDDMIYVSRRNVDKRFIDKDHFVGSILLDDGSVGYYGEHKPSVDTPIQLRLYTIFPQINYMIHAHCYVEGAPFTATAIPCGAIEEVKEIMAVIGRDNNETYYAINLIGHGCIVMAHSVEQLKGIPFISRLTPEIMERS